MVRTEDRDRVRTLTLARPEALNAFDDAQYRSLQRCLAEAASRSDIAVAVLTGEGRAFSSGQDLGEMARIGERGSSPVEGHGFRSLMDTLIGFPKPLLAAVNGLAVGLGMTILGHCDLVWVADTARLRAPFTSLGVVPEAASSYLLPATIGWQRAAHLFFGSGWIDADAAVEAGLAWRKSPPDRLMADVTEVAREIAAMPVVSLVATKRLMMEGRLEAVRRARRLEDEEFSRLAGAPANREAVAAFLERRDPDFSRVEGA
jgi:enoyl-CoA hydratase/carnithine racemase